jgi:hypothetical protein
MTTPYHKARAIFLAAFGVEPASEIAGFAVTVVHGDGFSAMYVRTTGVTRISDGATIVRRDTPIEALTEWAHLHDTDSEYVLGIYFAEVERGE